MNNNNRNTNRRRGRGNNRGPSGGQGGGGQGHAGQGNRIDSRARGNAPQLLEKYRKLAHDASLNDDRVQTEYYLQFADHYFRVLADSRSPKDEARARRDNERENAFDEDDDEDEREEVRSSQPPAGRRDRSNEQSATDEGSQGSEGDEDEGDEQENPFLRDARNRRPAARPRPRAAPRAQEGDGEGVDPGVLPPSISRASVNGDSEGDRGQGSREPADEAGEAAAERPRPVRRRRARPTDTGDAEALEAVS